MASCGAADISADAVFKAAICVRGISRPNRHLKHRSSTLTSAFSPDREDALPRVQAAAEPVKMRVNLWARRDLNPHTLSGTRT